MMIGHAIRAGRLRPVLFVVATALLLGTGNLAVGADSVSGKVGPYRMFDEPSDPSVICAYPDRSPTQLKVIRVRGPRVDFAYTIGEVGVVRWRLSAQRSLNDGPWQTFVSANQDLVVTVGDTRTFATQDLAITLPAGRARVRVVSKLTWFEQPGPPDMGPSGSVRHVMRHYAWNLYAPGDPIRYDDIERQSTDWCRQRWAP
jgi:hypothetical protein